jgi:hypothetical protein
MLVIVRQHISVLVIAHLVISADREPTVINLDIQESRIHSEDISARHSAAG